MRLRAVTLSDELVRAALADRLGELVVPMRPQPDTHAFGLSGREWVWPPTGAIRSADRKTWTVGCPLGAIGDELWSREAWSTLDGQTIYRTDYTYRPAYISRSIRWRSALQMRRADSRLRFVITANRCERVQHATSDSARLRGFASVAEFRAWWDRSTSGSKPRAPRDGESWNENPWVFVASVRRVEAKT